MWFMHCAIILRLKGWLVGCNRAQINVCLFLFDWKINFACPDRIGYFRDHFEHLGVNQVN